MGTRVLLPEYIFNLYFFEYSSTFKIKVLVLVLEYLGLVLVPNIGYTRMYISDQVSLVIANSINLSISGGGEARLDGSFATIKLYCSFRDTRESWS